MMVKVQRSAGRWNGWSGRVLCYGMAASVPLRHQRRRNLHKGDTARLGCAICSAIAVKLHEGHVSLRTMSPMRDLRPNSAAESLTTFAARLPAHDPDATPYRQTK